MKSFSKLMLVAAAVAVVWAGTAGTAEAFWGRRVVTSYSIPSVPVYTQPMVVSRPVIVAGYAPAPIVTGYAPAPVVTGYAPTTAYYAPTTTYYAPTVAPAVTTYYAPAPVFAAPVVAGYAPVAPVVQTYYAPARIYRRPFIYGW